MSTSPHLAEIRLVRKEPPKTFDSEKATRELAQQFYKLAQKIVYKKKLSKPIDKAKADSLKPKIASVVIFEEDVRKLEPFMAIWNKWRSFYFELPPNHIKNKQQVTVIRNILNFVKEHDLNIHILIAAIHRKYVGSRFRPTYQSVLTYGLETYDQYHDDVLSDIDTRRYEEGASHV